MRVDYKRFSFKKKVYKDEEYKYIARTAVWGLEKPYDNAIGSVITEFSIIEGLLRHLELLYLVNNSTIFNDYATILGDALSARLSAMEIFTLYIEYSIQMLLSFEPSRAEEVRETYKQMLNMLTDACELRNIIAHCDWSERMIGCWFNTKVRHNYKLSRYEYVMYKLSVNDIRKATIFLKHVRWQISNLGDNMRDEMSLYTPL